MFARLLNKGFRGSLWLLVLLFLCSAGITYFSPLALESNHYPNLFYNYFTRDIHNGFLISFLNFLFIGMGCLLVSLISSNQEITDKQNYFPVFIYLMICVAAVSPLQISPQIFTNVFVLFSLYKLLDIYREEHVLKPVFEAAFWLSCSAFISISSIIAFPLFFVILLILRSFYWREWAIALLGLCVPIFLYESLAYLCDFNQWYFFEAVDQFFDYMHSPSFSEYFLPILFLLVLLLIFSISDALLSGFGNTVKKQRAKTIFLWFLFFSILGIFSGGANSSSILLIYAIPVCFFVGDFLFGLKQIKFVNTLIALLIIAVSVVVLGKLNVI